ncbi:MAG TPA: hypothetical protein VLA88_02805 [Candidatus Saccharimonadales bacterium]|nr:hypothetical protein [Candidatus Saccharimonadales bacterium]
MNKNGSKPQPKKNTAAAPKRAVKKPAINIPPPDVGFYIYKGL